MVNTHTLKTINNVSKMQKKNNPPPPHTQKKKNNPPSVSVVVGEKSLKTSDGPTSKG